MKTLARIYVAILCVCANVSSGDSVVVQIVIAACLYAVYRLIESVEELA